jgi:sterol desaturase/sphingolipid hydroxylase (fatty acid hydroxylase superfamily)
VEVTMTTLVPAVIPLTFQVFFIAEGLWPARALRSIRGWWAIGLLGFVTSGVVITGTSAALTGALRDHALLDLGGLGTVAGGLVFFLVVDFVQYWIHRAEHRSHVFWRLVHQMHHAPDRIDTSAGFFAHPLELAVLGVSSGGIGALLGSSPGAAALGTFLSFALNVVVHTNIRTPRWLGLVIARPEMHAVHHEVGVHAFNYAFCSLYDRAFGTYRNPETFRGENGLGHDAWKKLGTLLFAGDVTRVAPQIPAAMPAPALS